VICVGPFISHGQRFIGIYRLAGVYVIFGLTGGNVRRDAIREPGSSVFFLLAILHWHFRAKTLCKIKLRTSKTPKNDRFLGKWEKLSVDPPLL